METLKKYLPLNLDLLANPVNWFIITLMVLFAGIAICYIMSKTQVNSGASQ